MGLKALFEKAAKTAFRAAGDIPELCTYRQDKSDELAKRPAVSFHVQVLFGKVNYQIVTAFKDIQPGDSLVLIRAAEMQVAPEKGDTITTPSGTVYRVVDQFLGMGEILYNLHLRAM